MEEDATVNRLLDSLALFEQLCNHTLLRTSTVVVLLNKMDLCYERLKKYPLKKYLAHYFGEQDQREYLGKLL